MKKIFAIDESDKSKVIKYIKAIKNRNSRFNDIFAIKIGLKTLLSNGLSITKTIKRISGLEIICDLKLADIPSLSGEIAEMVCDLGADGFVVHGFVGEKIIDQIYEKAPNLKIYLVSEMTHNDGGFTSKHVEDFANMAKNKRVFGIIGPGNKPEILEKIKSIVKDEVKVIATGIHSQGGEEAAAIRAGADYLIEGTKIRNELEKQNYKKKGKQFLIEGGLYFVVGVIIGIVILLLNKKFEIIKQFPFIVSIAVPTILGILGITIKIFVSKDYE